MPFDARDLSDHASLIDCERLPQTTCSPLNGPMDADEADAEAETWPLSGTLTPMAPAGPVTGKTVIGNIEIVWPNGVTWLAIWEGESLKRACARAEVIWWDRGCRVRVLERSFSDAWPVFREWPARPPFNEERGRSRG